MDRSEFEEKQYEGALCQELTAGEPTAYPSGQVLEELVGYDVALKPGHTKIWDLLDAGIPPGIVLSSGLWSSAPKAPAAADLPRDLVSVILQVKRPQRLDHWRAGQHHFWRGPYYRFYTTPHQQTQIAALESAVACGALVRYVSAAFLTLESLYAHQRNRVIAEHSSFVTPAALVGHRLWSYAGAGTVGYVNPEGSEAKGDTLGSLLETARGSATRQTLFSHVSDLADQVGAGEAADEWLDVMLESGVSQERRTSIRAWGAFAGVVARTGAEWLVLDMSEGHRSPNLSPS